MTVEPTPLGVIVRLDQATTWNMPERPSSPPDRGDFDGPSPLEHTDVTIDAKELHGIIADQLHDWVVDWLSETYPGWEIEGAVYDDPAIVDGALLLRNVAAKRAYPLAKEDEEC
jgi:hypothetical protein